jgi:branched-subunit amino acid transport protein
VSAAWTTVLALAVGTAAIKAAGPVALGGRALPVRLERVVALLAPSLIAALVIVQTFSTDGALVVDARAAGLVAAAGAIALRRSTIEIVLVAAAITAVLRALT